MNRASLAAVLVLTVLSVTGCQKDDAHVPDVTVEKAAELHKSGATTFVDANTEEFRKEKGIVPGAVMLSSSSKFATEELPPQKDRKLVFYCSNRL
jgi:hypothetical protein